MTKSKIKTRIKEINLKLGQLLQDDRQIKNRSFNWEEDIHIKKNEIKRQKLLDQKQILENELANPTDIVTLAGEIVQIVDEIVELESKIDKKKRDLKVTIELYDIQTSKTT